MDQVTLTEKQYGFTNIHASKLSFEWKIYNFKVSGKDVGEHLLSPEFSDSDKNTIWYIELYPAGEAVHSKDYLSIYLYLRSVKGTAKIKVDLKFYILNNERKQCFVVEEENTFTKSRGYGWNKFVEIDTISNNTYLPNDCLTIGCDITIGLNEVTSQIDICDVLASNQKLQLQLLSNYKSLFNNKEIHDAIITVSGRKFYVHKAILAAHSPVFLAMLKKNSFKENVQKEIEINDTDSDVFQELLRFIYSGEIKNMNDIVYELLVAADKYIIKELLTKCEQYLYSNLNVDNVINIISLADNYNAINLKKCAINFFIAHRKVVNIDENKFFEILNPCTVQEIVRSFIAQ